ncbi:MULTISPECIES: fimbrial protein [Providencia]|uniref:fimbrial protein n=1 Tax=Providencia TaxID=586 RepID=UPI002AB51FE4|nr:type 1 fimbrial protein [Providencia stuartii]
MKLSQLAITTVLATSVISFNSIADNTGVINFTGSVVNTPCNIEQTSLKQTVDFGQLSRKVLESDKSAEAVFDITFTGCDLANFGQNEQTGKPESLSAMELVFTGQNYADATNTLLSTSTGNTNNLGVAIEGFEFGKATDVLPRIVNQKGNNTLSFKAIAKRVDASKNVEEGQFSAISNFRITYK